MIDQQRIEAIDRYVDASAGRIKKTRRDLHQIPETGNDLPKTRAYILDRLREYDVTIRECVGENGMVATLYGGKPGKTVAYRADMDALPLMEENDFSHKSTHPGKMHACGHDGHVTIALGILEILSKFQKEITGQVKFIFQPAEETTGGALKMIQDGALKNPTVDYIFGAHIWPSLKSGKMGLIKGPIMAGTDIIEILIEGKGGHGAIPHKAVNPISVGSKIVSEVEGIKNYFVPSSENSVISFGAFQAGEVNNVIPHTGRLLGSVRTFSKATQSIYMEQLKRIVHHVGQMYDAKCTLNYRHNYPPTINSPEIIDRLESCLIAYGQKEVIHHLEEPSMGAEDFSFFLQEVPGAFVFLGTQNEEKGITQEIHHPLYDLDEEILPFNSAIFSKLILDFLEK